MHFNYSSYGYFKRNFRFEKEEGKEISEVQGMSEMDEAMDEEGKSRRGHPEYRRLSLSHYRVGMGRVPMRLFGTINT